MPRFVCLVFFVLFFRMALAGPVNSPGSFPFAAMNSSGDSVYAGDWKVRARWKGQYAQIREAVAPFRFSETAADVFSGGVAASFTRSEVVGIACSRRRAALFDSTRTPQFPAGQWREIFAVGNVEIGKSAHSCAMLENGIFAVLQALPLRVLLSTGAVVDLPKMMGQDFRIVAVGNFFAVISEKQILWVRASDNGALFSTPVNHGFGGINSFSRFSANQNFILKADSSSVLLASVSKPAFNEFPALLAASRLPISPCEDNEMCGASLAHDDSWAVSGYWGTYVGIESRFSRLNFPNLSTGRGGVAFAHSAKNGSFVYVGADDADLGTLPTTFVGNNEQEHLNLRERYFVWTKNREGEEGRLRPVFFWSTPRKMRFQESVSRYAAFVHYGKLPHSIPKNWVAWEKEVMFDAFKLPVAQPAFQDAPLSWWPQAVHVSEALQEAGRRGLAPREVVVGIVDSGAQLNHPWLQNSFFENPGEIRDNGIDDDNNGFVDDIYGYDFVGDDAEPNDLFGHGTHVAGLVGARYPNSGEPVALNGAIKIRLARALDGAGKSNSIDLARAVAYLADARVHIMNCSWGGGPVTQSLRDAFDYAVGEGVLVLSSAGNDRLDTDKSPQVPKMFSGVVPVGAYSENGSKAAFSNWGKNSVQWFAPGDKIFSTLPNSALGEKSGTSMASPIAANIAGWIYGILLAQNPSASRDTLVELVKKTLCASGEQGSLQGLSKCGRIDALRALQFL